MESNVTDVPPRGREDSALEGESGHHQSLALKQTAVPGCTVCTAISIREHRCVNAYAPADDLVMSLILCNVTR